MEIETLKKANAIKKEIDKLEKFIDGANSRWTGKIIKQKPKLSFIANGYGFLESISYDLDTTTKNELLIVLENKLKRLKDELSTL